MGILDHFRVGSVFGLGFGFGLVDASAATGSLALPRGFDDEEVLASAGLRPLGFLSAGIICWPLPGSIPCEAKQIRTSL